MFITDIHSLGVEQFAGTTVHRRLVLEHGRPGTESGPTASRRRPAPGPRSPTPATTPRPCSTSRPSRPPAPTTPTTVVGELEGKEVDDVFLRNGEIRAEDHRVIHDAYLAKVKDPGRRHGGLGLRGDRHHDPRGRRPSGPVEDSGCSMMSRRCAAGAPGVLRRRPGHHPGEGTHERTPPVHGPGPGRRQLLRARRPRPGHHLRRPRRRELRPRRVLHARRGHRRGPAGHPRAEPVGGACWSCRS